MGHKALVYNTLSHPHFIIIYIQGARPSYNFKVVLSSPGFLKVFQNFSLNTRCFSIIFTPTRVAELFQSNIFCFLSHLTQRLKHSVNNSGQYGHTELTLVEESNVTELDDAQLPALTDVSTELRIVKYCICIWLDSRSHTTKGSTPLVP